MLMQLVVSKKDLLRVLSRCQGVADRKSTMPILGNVLLEVSGPDRLKLAATDVVVAIRASIPAEVEKGGSIAVGARELFERVKMMPEGNVSIATQDGATTIRAVGQARRYTLHGVAGDQFPHLPEPAPGAERLQIKASALGRLIAATHFSISSDETRLHLSSALLEWDGDRVRMVTTDGHRLSKMEIAIPRAQASASMLIPVKGIAELKRLTEEAKNEGQGEKDVAIIQSGPNVFFEIAGLDFSVKLVDAQFPPYGQVIPAPGGRQAIAPRTAVAEALRAVSIAASDRTGGVKVQFGKGMLRFSSEGPDSGDGFDEVSVDYSGSELSIGFNAKYILDVLGAMDSEDVRITINGELDPAVLSPAVQPEGSDYLAVVMPMRI